MKRAITVFLLLAVTYVISLFVIPRPHAAVPCSVPYTFFPNTVADANQVNANFTALLSCFALSARQGANSDITSLSGLTTPLTVPQGGTGGPALLPANGVVIANGSSPLIITGVGTTGQVLTGTGGVPTWAVFAGKPGLGVNTNYAIVPTDCGYILDMFGGELGLNFPSTMSGACDVAFCNSDSNSGKIMQGAIPAGLRNTLYPGQCAEVTWSGSAWLLTVDPGRWNLTGAGITFYVGYSGASDLNDGLNTTTSFMTLARCIHASTVEVSSTYQTAATCHVAAGAALNECINIYGPQPQNNAYIKVVGDGAGGTWYCDTPNAAAAEVGDMGVLIIDNMTMGLSSSHGGVIQMHNHGILDFGDPGVCSGSALALIGNPNISFLIGSDGGYGSVGLNCSFGYQAPTTTCTAVFDFNNGAQITVQGGITITAFGACNNGYFIQLGMGSQWQFSQTVTFNPTAAAGNTGIYSSMHPYNVWGNSTLLNYTGTTIPGAQPSNQGMTGAYCTVVSMC